MRPSPVRTRASVVATRDHNPAPPVLRGREASVMSADIEDATPGDAQGPRKKFIVRCPACEGSGHVVPFGSRARVGCRLCWERGRVSRIVAETWYREQGKEGL